MLTEAVRDEGVSHHLPPPARYPAADPELTAALAPAEGVETVEMEAQQRSAPAARRAAHRPPRRW